MCRFKIYTKTGDKGESSLYNGQRKPKTDGVFAALGDVDELNACLGLAAAALDGGGALAAQLAGIQSRLLDVGSAVATPLDASSDRKVAATAFPEDAAVGLEDAIDAMDDVLPPLTQFILPGGGEAAARLHVARAVCRRAERAVVALGEGATPASVRVYLNRLSDYLFTAARKAAQDAGAEETTYKKAR
jgi:cob(I)alamin adenosyltransferase